MVLQDIALHDRLKAAGVTKLGARFAILTALKEPTISCLEEHLDISDSAQHAALTERFVVMHAPCIVARQSRDPSASRVASWYVGDEIQLRKGINVDGWLQLANSERLQLLGSDEPTEGWVLRDGARLGLGVLIAPLPPPSETAALAQLPPLTVRATDGLCNRLRIVLSFTHIARQHARPLRVWWPVNEVCNGRWDDAFAPLEGVEFVNGEMEPHPFGFAPPSQDFHPLIKAKGEEAITACYAALEPSAAVRARVAANVRALRPDAPVGGAATPTNVDGAAAAASSGGFISLHMRRTDHWGSTTTDAEFVAFAKAHPGHAIFLATDNAQTQSVFLDSPQLGPRMRACTRIVPDSTRLRQTSLADAATDVFTAAAADGPFKGCWSSSFSDTILRLRQVHGTHHDLDEHSLSDAQMQMGVTLHTPGGHLAHSPGQPMTTSGRGLALERDAPI